MTAHVKIEEDLFGRGVKVSLVKSNPDGSGVAYSISKTEVYSTAEQTFEPIYTPLELPEEMARALYDALRKHFGHAPETSTLRADFEHERQRVDRILEHLILPRVEVKS